VGYLKSVGVLPLRNDYFSEDITMLSFRYTDQRKYTYKERYTIVEQEKGAASQRGNTSSDSTSFIISYKKRCNI
jgi:hypothetical protein